MTKPARAATVALLLLALGSCATRREMRGQEASGLDRKLTFFAFVESGDLVDLIVDTKAARYREDAEYIPIEFSVANRALNELTITRESFVLVDDQGNRYPAASPRELMQHYEFLDWDRRLSELPGIVDARFAAFTRYPSNFSPRRQAIRGSNVVRDSVSLPKFGYIVDYIYFPRPTTGVKNHRFEMFLQAPQLQDPVFVKFEIK